MKTERLSFCPMLLVAALLLSSAHGVAQTGSGVWVLIDSDYAMGDDEGSASYNVIPGASHYDICCLAWPLIVAGVSSGSSLSLNYNDTVTAAGRDYEAWYYEPNEEPEPTTSNPTASFHVTLGAIRGELNLKNAPADGSLITWGAYKNSLQCDIKQEPPALAKSTEATSPPIGFPLPWGGQATVHVDVNSSEATYPLAATTDIDRAEPPTPTDFFWYDLKTHVTMHLHVDGWFIDIPSLWNRSEMESNLLGLNKHSYQLGN